MDPHRWPGASAENNPVWNNPRQQVSSGPAMVSIGKTRPLHVQTAPSSHPPPGATPHALTYTQHHRIGLPVSIEATNSLLIRSAVPYFPS